MKKLSVVGIGPGSYEGMTLQAIKTIEAADVIVGYTVYCDLLKPHFPDKEFFSTPMMQEVERCRDAIHTCQRSRRGFACWMATAQECGRESRNYPHTLQQRLHMGNRSKREWESYWCDGLWPLMRLRPACPRGRAAHWLLGGQAILESRLLHRSAAADVGAHCQNHQYTIAYQRTFHRQSRLRPSYGEMQLHPHWRDLYRS